MNTVPRIVFGLAAGLDRHARRARTIACRNPMSPPAFAAIRRLAAAAAGRGGRADGVRAGSCSLVARARRPGTRLAGRTRHQIQSGSGNRLDAAATGAHLRGGGLGSRVARSGCQRRRGARHGNGPYQGARRIRPRSADNSAPACSTSIPLPDSTPCGNSTCSESTGASSRRRTTTCKPRAAARYAVITSLIADVVRAYVDLRGFQVQAGILRNAGDVLRESLRIVNIRYQRGITNELDVALATRELDTLRGADCTAGRRR